jgi:hypothetical protein
LNPLLTFITLNISFNIFSHPGLGISTGLVLQLALLILHRRSVTSLSLVDCFHWDTNAIRSIPMHYTQPILKPCGLLLFCFNLFLIQIYCFIHTYIHTFIHTYIRTYVRIYIHTSLLHSMDP